MTPKKKAEELIQEMFSYIPLDTENIKITIIQARFCARVAVRKIIESYDGIFDDYVINPAEWGGYNNMKKYYEQVYKELEKMK